MPARTAHTYLPILLAPLLMAHTLGDGVAHTAGFVAGLSHPVLGFDHLLAMLSVGILSAQLGGRAVWSVPLAFVSVMALGGILGLNGVQLPAVEVGIAFSVLALGIAIAASKKMPAWVAMMFVAFFALFHGHAHGNEMPGLTHPLYYALGFLAGTALIHVAGVAIAKIATLTPRSTQMLRVAGAGMSGVGLYFLIA